MSDKDQIKDLFSDKLGNFEAKVSPELWANVASQVGAASTGAAATGGMSLLTKAIIGISGAAVLTTGVVLYSNSSDDEIQSEPRTEVNQSTKETIEPKAGELDSKSIELATNNGSNNEVVPAVKPEPVREVVPTTGPYDGKAHPKYAKDLDPPVTPTPEPPKVTPKGSQVSEEEAKTEVQEAREKDIVELSHNPNIVDQDDPLKDIDVPVEQTNVVSADEIEVIFPNVFTPNGDGRNDTYSILSSNVEFSSFEFVVYDRRGQVVMIAKNADFVWTAMNPQTGTYLERNVYAYVMIGETIDGVQYKKSGTITIE